MSEAATVARLAPLAVAVPLLLAAVLLGLRRHVPRWLSATLSVLLACVIAAFFAVALSGPAWQRPVTWLGDWLPHGGRALGIALVVDATSAELVTLVAVIWAAAFAFGYDVLDDTDQLLAPMGLVFLGAMCGLALAGDLFTLFVFYELMGAVAYALTAYQTERSALSGALTFAVSNSVGAFLILIGLTLLYVRTGALNLAQMGAALSAAPADALVLVAFAFIMCGFLVKSAIVPFHFWLPETHAVAPSPVSVLFSGVMVELGMYAAARVYWTVFDGALQPYRHVVGGLLLATAALTLLVGGVGAVLQRHLKRMLAFSTVCHAGLAWTGFALFSVAGGAGALVYMPGHGLVKGTLFIIAGILLYLGCSVDELTLRGRGYGHWVLAALCCAAGLALAGLPPFATFHGGSLIVTSAGRAGHHWVPWVIVAGEALTGGAVLRAAGRVFLGLGRDAGAEQFAPTETEEDSQSDPHTRVSGLMVLPACLLLLAALGLGLVPGLDHQALRAGAQLEDQRGYIATVLEGAPADSAAYETEATQAASTPAEARIAALFACGSVLCAVAVAAWGLRRRRAQAGSLASRAFAALHSGLPGDCVLWIAVGAAVFVAVIVWI